MAFTHDRAAWEDPAVPVTGPAMNWARIDTVAVHYTAADDLIDGDPGEHAEDLPAYLRSIQSSYVRTRGYSIGYGVGVDWLGGSWELRGVDIKCAANKGHNEHTIAILVLVDGNDMATTHAATEIRRLIAWFEVLAGRQLTITGHGQLRDPDAATACPGSGLRAQIALGEFSPRWTPPAPFPPPIPPIVIPEDAMYVHLISQSFGEWLWQPGTTPQGFKSVPDAVAILGALNPTPARANVSDVQLVSLFDPDDAIRIFGFTA
jgi:hypothetical protein